MGMHWCEGIAERLPRANLSSLHGSVGEIHLAPRSGVVPQAGFETPNFLEEFFTQCETNPTNGIHFSE